MLYCADEYHDILSAGRQRVGNKAYNLAYLKSICNEIEIPISICLLVHDEHQRANALIELKQIIKHRFDFPVIIRSSSTIEDSKKSCAGIFLSEICNSTAELDSTVERVINSGNTEEVKKYCEKNGLAYCNIKVAVLIQAYNIPSMSGVIFTKHPVTNCTDEIYVEYNDNTSDAVTAGTQKPKYLILSKQGISNHSPPFQQLKNIALSIESIWGHPVDIEWIMHGNNIQVVQVRQITT